MSKERGFSAVIAKNLEKGVATYSKQGMNMRTTQKVLLLALAAGLAAGSVAAAQWESVVAAKGDRIELDKTRIARQADGRTTAWSRLALDRDMIDEYGMRYTSVEALNRYDCEKRTFTTLKRVYRRDAQLVREELVNRTVELAAESGSVDDKLLAAACKPRTVADARKLAETVEQTLAEARGSSTGEARALDALGGKGAAMFADMRAIDNGMRPRGLLVADAAKAADKATEKTAEKPVEAKPADGKPRFIELPKIDKSQFETAKPVEAKPADTKPADAKPAPKAPDTKPAVTKAEAKPVDKGVERPAAVTRYDYERQLATSGPRRTKKAEAPAHVEAHRHIHWSYEGEGGPANWAKIDSANATCAQGKRQSPIDIREGIIKVDLEPIKFDYRPTQFRITDNGHTLHVDVGDGSSITVMERQYQLMQFHFHKPSEERINGRPFDMVAHLVHKDYDGNLAVIAVLLERGSEHPLIQTLWNNIPLEKGQSTSPATVIDLNNLLPEKRSYYTYMGSLTTPPCTEEVLWMVLKQPAQVSMQQIAIFNRLYPNNARPIQPTNGRLVKETR